MWCTRLIGNFHATDVQQTCNRRATHVQHTCNTTTFPVNFQSKWLSGHFRRPKATSKGKGENFAPSSENHRNSQQKCSCCTSCCTCVARVLHVCEPKLWKYPLMRSPYLGSVDRHIYIYIFNYIFTSVHACMYVCMHVFMYVCMYACMHSCMHVCRCMCACVFVSSGCIYIYICVFI